MAKYASRIKSIDHSISYRFEKNQNNFAKAYKSRVCARLTFPRLHQPASLSLGAFHFFLCDLFNFLVQKNVRAHRPIKISCGSALFLRFCARLCLTRLIYFIIGYYTTKSTRLHSCGNKLLTMTSSNF